MKTAWTKHIKDAKEKEEFERLLLGSRPLLNRLAALLEETERELNAAETDQKQYDNPNWSHKQADRNGFRRCLRTIKDLIDLDRNKE